MKNLSVRTLAPNTIFKEEASTLLLFSKVMKRDQPSNSYLITVHICPLFRKFGINLNQLCNKKNDAHCIYSL